MSLTSSQRLQEALSHREPDRVPYALSANMHPSRDMGLTIEDYFSRPEYVIEGQLRLREKLGNDMLSCYPFAAQEMVAWGGEVIYFEDGPPNAGPPIIKRPEDIMMLEPPDVAGNPALEPILRATAGLKEAVGDDIPVAGVIIAPFSLPIMQMGFEAYLDLIYEQPDLLERLLRINTEYCVAWGKAQLRAGAGALVCSDPASSPTITTSEIALRYGLPATKEVISRLQGAVMVHFASGRSLYMVDHVQAAGAIGLSVSAEEDLGQLKASCRGRLTVVGSLNALEMVHWSQEEAEAQVKKALAQAGPGGGFVLSDNHGEIPFQVDMEILLAVAEAVRRWGVYPLDWVDTHDV